MLEVFTVKPKPGAVAVIVSDWDDSRERNLIVSFNEMIGGNLTVSDEFTFSGPHTMTAARWEKAARTGIFLSLSSLEEAMKRIAPP
ncbi:hypothetical protein KMZ29_19285 [Bradyrhizobium sediminis]|uniref:Uncharacterized protein n=1 Tax=Bradyrhizobium sediminis TaxID=2840469 RepID=A0A975NBQ2_9BRAD|nr:hypothetical protein [Bradyrhizobium sediminis]QWG11855.1 hypothetical protein KMZ29_19285 [Bradyrhizobium sediminis]